MKNTIIITLSGVVLVVLGAFIMDANGFSFRKNGIKVSPPMSNQQINNPSTSSGETQNLVDDSLDFTFQFPKEWEYTVRQTNSDYTERLFSDEKHRLVATLRRPEKYPNYLEFHAQDGADKLIATNDDQTKVYYAVYRLAGDTMPDKKGGFALMVWERGRSEYKDLTMNNEKNAWMLTVQLGNVDKAEESVLLKKIDGILSTFTFKDKIPTSDRITYEDKKFGFSFSYPKTFSVASAPFRHFDDAVTLAAFSINYPTSYLEGTNAQTALISAEVVQEADIDKCLAPFIESTPSSTLAVINNVAFKRIKSTGAGAGNRYEAVAYAHVKQGKCYVISSQFGWGILENYDPAKRPKQFDDTAAIKAFEDIVATYRLE